MVRFCSIEETSRFHGLMLFCIFDILEWIICIFSLLPFDYHKIVTFATHVCLLTTCVFGSKLKRNFCFQHRYCIWPLTREKLKNQQFDKIYWFHGSNGKKHYYKFLSAYKFKSERGALWKSLLNSNENVVIPYSTIKIDIIQWHI